MCSYWAVPSAFGLFYLGERVFHLDRAHHPDTDVFEAVGGGTSDDFPDAHVLAILVTPARAKILLVAVIGTQLIATFIAVYGLFMMPPRLGFWLGSCGVMHCCGSS